MHRYDRDHKVSAVIWAYQKTYKQLTRNNLFRILYGKKVLVPMEYIVSSLRIVALTEMTDVDFVEKKLSQIVQMEEERFVARFHRNTEKKRQKVWHDLHIRTKHFEVRGIVLLYDRKFLKHPGKLKAHWLGPYVIVHITDAGAVKLHKLDGTPVA